MKKDFNYQVNIRADAGKLSATICGPDGGKVADIAGQCCLGSLGWLVVRKLEELQRDKPKLPELPKRWKLTATQTARLKKILAKACGWPVTQLHDEIRQASPTWSLEDRAWWAGMWGDHECCPPANVVARLLGIKHGPLTEAQREKFQNGLLDFRDVRNSIIDKKATKK